jgi:hypothetical protein
MDMTCAHVKSCIIFHPPEMMSVEVERHAY